MRILQVEHQLRLWQAVDRPTAKRISCLLIASGLLLGGAALVPSVVCELKNIKAKPRLPEQLGLCSSPLLMLGGLFSLMLSKTATRRVRASRANLLVETAKRRRSHVSECTTDSEPEAVLRPARDITDSQLTALPQDLEGIDLSYCSNITEQGLIALLERCPELKELHLRGCSCITGRLIAALVNHGNSLQVVDMKDCSPLDVSLPLLQALLYGQPQLRTLILPDLAGTSKLLECDREICVAEKLQVLEIGKLERHLMNAALQKDHRHVIPFDRLPRLRSLHLDCNLDSLYLFIVLNHCPHLEELSIPSRMLWPSYDGSCHSIGLRELVQDARPLRRLTIRPAEVDVAQGDFVSELLEKLPELEELTVLGLIGGGQSLSKRLTDLCPNLRRLVVRGESWLGSSYEIMAFRTNHPHLEIFDMIQTEDLSSSDG